MKLRPFSRTECSSVVMVLLDLFTTHLDLSIFPASSLCWCSRERFVATRFANFYRCFLLTSSKARLRARPRNSVTSLWAVEFCAEIPLTTIASRLVYSSSNLAIVNEHCLTRMSRNRFSALQRTVAVLVPLTTEPSLI